jgi:hypothetical protein
MTHLNFQDAETSVACAHAESVYGEDSDVAQRFEDTQCKVRRDAGWEIDDYAEEGDDEEVSVQGLHEIRKQVCHLNLVIAVAAFYVIAACITSPGANDLGAMCVCCNVNSCLGPRKRK